MKKIFILTGEPSGDKLASTVVAKLKQNHSDEITAKDELTKEYLRIVEQIEGRRRNFKIYLSIR